MINSIKLTNVENDLVYGGLCNCRCLNKKSTRYDCYNVGQSIIEKPEEMRSSQKCHFYCVRSGYKSFICEEKNKSDRVLSIVSDDMIKNLMDLLVSDSSLLPENSEQ